jgi:hypothetical protein
LIKVRKDASGIVFNAFALGFFLCSLAAVAQTSPPQAESLQQKVQEMQMAVATTEQQLHSYQWVESTTLTAPKKSIPMQQSLCRYGANGTVIRTVLETSVPQKSGPRGPFKQIAEAKKEKIEDEVDQIQLLVQTYLRLDPIKIREVLRAGKVFFEHDGTNSEAVILADYAKSDDQLRISLNQTTQQVERISIKTYLDTPEQRDAADVAVMEEIEQVRFVLCCPFEHLCEFDIVVGADFLLGEFRLVLLAEQRKQSEVPHEDVEVIRPIEESAGLIPVLA